MNKFAVWVQENDKKQRGIAAKLDISTSTLHDILRKNKIPSLKVAYEIEKYTNGFVQMEDWINQDMQNAKDKSTTPKNAITSKK